MSAVNADPLRRYAIIVDAHGHGPIIRSCCRTHNDAVIEATRVRSFQNGRSPARVTVDTLELQPNSQVVEFGRERFDDMLTDVGDNRITLTGSLDELIACGAIGGYIRDILGKSGCKSSCDEYGNQYYLYKRGKDRYELNLYFSDEPETPHFNAIRKLGMATADPLEIDISEILTRIQSKGSAA